MNHVDEAMASLREAHLYRCFAADGSLLYVGVTGHIKKRFKQHAVKSAWWGDVAKVEAERYSERDAALAAERKAIVAEQPLHNIRREFAERHMPPVVFVEPGQ